MTVAALWMMAMVLGSGSGAPDRFAYQITMTPEEGPLDPAVEARYSPAWKTCQTSRPATADMPPCFQAEFTRQDAQLNRTWATTLRRLPLSQQPALLRAQRAWIAARNPFCQRYAGGLRGSLVSVAYLDCRIELTIRRTLWLENL